MINLVACFLNLSKTNLGKKVFKLLLRTERYTILFAIKKIKISIAAISNYETILL